MIYSIFVLATLIVVMHSIMLPVVDEIYSTEPKPQIATVPGNKSLLYLILGLITILAAPIMFIVWLLPKLSLKFKTHLVADLKKS